MRGFNFGIRRQDFDTGIENEDHHEPQEMPHLLNSSSGSSSSHDGSSPHGGSHNHRGSKKHHHYNDAPDNSILRGAEILRRQLISGEKEQDEGELYGAEQSPRTHNPSVSELTDENVSEEEEEWSDPWKHKSRHTKAGSWEGEEGDEKTAFSSPVGDASEWARLSDDEGDGNERSKHRRTTSTSRKHPSIREKVMSHFSHQTEEEDGSYSNERNYLPGGLVRNSNPEHSRVRSDRRPGSPRNWDENTSEAVSSHALDLLKDLESDERALQSLKNEDEMSYFLEASKQDSGPHNMMTIPNVDESPKFPNIVSPRSRKYEQLQKDPGYQHAQRAGLLWQCLISQHVRLPSTWWNGARAPPMGIAERRMWTYMGRHRVGGNQYLNDLVRSRGSAGRVVLHLVVRDIVTMAPVQDIAVGCFHPNARGIRTTTAFDPSIEDSRDIWVASRKRVDDVSLMESLLKLNEEDVSDSPLGGRHVVDNTNMRAVFGETAPVQTVFVLESELYEVFSHFMDSNIPPAAILLGRYLKEWY
jgi:hypothetical protein